LKFSIKFSVKLLPREKNGKFTYLDFPDKYSSKVGVTVGRQANHLVHSEICRPK